MSDAPRIAPPEKLAFDLHIDCAGIRIYAVLTTQMRSRLAIVQQLECQLQLVSRYYGAPATFTIRRKPVAFDMPEAFLRQMDAAIGKDFHIR